MWYVFLLIAACHDDALSSPQVKVAPVQLDSAKILPDKEEIELEQTLKELEQ